MGCDRRDEVTWSVTAKTSKIVMAFSLSDDVFLTITSRINNLKRVFVFFLLRTHTEQPDTADV